MQHILDSFSTICALNLINSLKKNVIMYHPAPEELYSEPTIYAYDQKFQVGYMFVKLSDNVNMTNMLKDEISLRAVHF